MALITIPAVAATSMTLRLVRGDVPLELMGGGAVIVQSTKALWILEFPIKPQTLADSKAWWAALVQLAKIGNTFQVESPGWVQGAGYGGATPLVFGAGQLGLALNCDGASNNTTIAVAGDPIEVNGEYKVLIQDAVSDGAGLVTFNFEPALRASPANNAPVDVKTPKMTCRLLNAEATISGRVGDIYNQSVHATEHYGP